MNRRTGLLAGKDWPFVAPQEGAGRDAEEVGPRGRENLKNSRPDADNNGAGQ